MWRKWDRTIYCKINCSEIGKGSEFVFNIPIKILEEENVILTCDNKDYHVEKCNIEFSDIYSI